MSEEMTHPPSPQLTPQQQDIENALTAFRPAAPQMNRDTLMYAAGLAAGKRAAGRQALPWRIAAGLLICATATLALWHPQRTVYVDRPSNSLAIPSAKPSLPVAEPAIPVAPAYFPEGDSYLQTRQRILVLGLNALPSLPDLPPSAPPHTHLRSDLPDGAPAWQRRAAGLFTGDHS